MFQPTKQSCSHAPKMWLMRKCISPQCLPLSLSGSDR